LLLFDLDETLAHRVKNEGEYSKKADVHLSIKLLSGGRCKVLYLIMLQAGFNIRPFTQQLLEEANKHFEVGVFTASHRFYADAVVDHIDPEGKLI